MRVVPLTLKQANQLVADLHRHHKPVVGHRFSIGVEVDGKLVGACIVGRPVARYCDQNMTAEVTRVVTDGTINACSMLYGAAARACKAMGYTKIQTYTLIDELGTTLKASGWIREAVTQGGQWTHTHGKTRRTDQPTSAKVRWARYLNN